MSEFLDTDTAYSTATTVQEIELNGEAAKIEVADATIEQIEELEEKEANGDLTEDELIQQVFDEYLVRPEGLNAKKMPTSKMQAVMKGILKAWGVAEGDLDEFIGERQGN